LVGYLTEEKLLYFKLLFVILLLKFQRISWHFGFYLEVCPKCDLCRFLTIKDKMRNFYRMGFYRTI